MTVCRHAFHNGVIAYTFQFGESAIHRIFMARIIFVKAIFSCLNLKPDNEFLPYNMPEFSDKTGHGLTDIVIV